MSYNYKRIEAKNFIEIWSYSKPILSGYTLDATDRKKPRTFEELTPIEKGASLKRKERYYKEQRHRIKRIVDLNINSSSSFLTLTFSENIQDHDYAIKELQKFWDKIRYFLKTKGYRKLKYITTWEYQKRGAIHFHAILFDIPYLDWEWLKQKWQHGSVYIKKISYQGLENFDGEIVPVHEIGLYLSKYFTKELEKKAPKSRAYYCSKNLVLPYEEQWLLPIEEVPTWNEEDCLVKKSYDIQIRKDVDQYETVQVTYTMIKRKKEK